MTPDRPTVGSIFSGIGSFDLGFQNAGFSISWQIEIDKWCARVLAKHWPDVQRFGDVCRVQPEQLSPVDVVIFRSPCQNLSQAGNREGLDGEQSRLFYEAIRLIHALSPRFVVFENVPGLFSSNG